MTLRQDCELWATFDSEDVDAQRGIVRDRSGKGRTLEASGGPTYGQASPVGEAVGFDGADDKFTTTIQRGSPKKYTTSALFKLPSNSETYTIHQSGGSFDFAITDDSNSTRVEAADTDGNFATVKIGRHVTDFAVVTAVWDAGELRGYLNGNLFASTSATFTSDTLRQNDDATFIGGRASSSFLDGTVAFAAEWSRVLSDPEIEELNRMTDRMVSKL